MKYNCVEALITEQNYKLQDHIGVDAKLKPL